MKSLLIIPFILCTMLLSCNNSTDSSTQVNKQDTIIQKQTPDSLISYNISWLDSSKVQLTLDTLLSHTKKAFQCDSAIALEYIGFVGEHSFLPINQKGQWINTIKKSKRLSHEQLQLVNSVLGDKKTFEHPMIVGCYEPRLAIVYFKEGKVIGQSAICLSCLRVESTAKLGSGNNYASFNEGGLKQLEKLCHSLQFSDCVH